MTRLHTGPHNFFGTGRPLALEWLPGPAQQVIVIECITSIEVLI